MKAKTNLNMPWKKYLKKKPIDSSDNGNSKLSKFFAHPFVIALFTSGVLMFIGYIFNNSYDIHQKQSAYLREVTDKKYKLISESAHAIEKEVSLLYQMKFYKSWLVDKSNKIDNKGRTRSQIIKEYERIWAEYNNNCHYCMSSLAQVAAFYDDEMVVKRAKHLIEMIDNFQEIEDFEKYSVTKLFDESKKIYIEMYRLSDDMGKEVKKEVREHNKGGKLPSIIEILNYFKVP